jgi:methylglyoxal synthase
LRIALIAHDQKKQEILSLVEEHLEFLSRHELIATSTSGKLIAAELKLAVNTVLSGPLGGDAQISALAATGQLEAIIFLRDPLTAQPHEPDISALMRICDVHGIPLATNRGTASYLLRSLALGSL